jgi:hypothetical protein
MSLAEAQTILTTERKSKINEEHIVKTRLTNPNSARMISVRRLVGNRVAVVMMCSSQQLSRLKDHFDNVNICVHLSAYRRGAM